MGCGLRVSSGITWVLSHVDRAIFLEDDCLPEPSFFKYCAELLRLYEVDERIGSIAGSNLFGTRPHSGASYFFGKYPMIWGWATWRRVWQHYDFDVKDWPEASANNWLRSVTNAREFRHWQKSFETVHKHEVDTWDYQFAYLAFRRGQLCVLPSVNLISNIGFRDDATHTTQVSRDANLATQPLMFPLVHPRHVQADQEFGRTYVARHTYPKARHTRTELVRRFLKWF